MLLYSPCTAAPLPVHVIELTGGSVVAGRLTATPLLSVTTIPVRVTVPVFLTT